MLSHRARCLSRATAVVRYDCDCVGVRVSASVGLYTSVLCMCAQAERHTGLTPFVLQFGPGTPMCMSSQGCYIQLALRFDLIFGFTKPVSVARILDDLVLLRMTSCTKLRSHVLDCPSHGQAFDGQSDARLLQATCVRHSTSLGAM